MARPAPSPPDEQPLDVLYEDNALIAINKSSGVIVQGAAAGTVSLADEVKAWLKQKYDKPGNVYIGVVHRLDRPVSGVVVFARNSKCAARLSEQFRERRVRKFYLAVVEGRPHPVSGRLEDGILRRERAAKAVIVPVDSPGAARAVLAYRTLSTSGGRTLLEIEPETGRTHQIRGQLAARGWPIVGDGAYGAKTLLDQSGSSAKPSAAIALHAARLVLEHPVQRTALELSAPLPRSWRELGFSDEFAHPARP
ncbi:MAG: RluA family pseudouridine synthase [Planctomycetes bacterium]|nr:RluA family pseudouridine synthase [Planctomycetota bacterium]